MAERPPGRSVIPVLCAVLGLALSPTAYSAENIGFTTVVKNHVIGRLAPEGGGGGDGQTAAERALARGDRIFQNETIETGEESQAQLLFRDETVLTVGPTAEVVLDRFVYDPGQGSGEMVLDTAKGAFRFVSGSAASDNYKIRTPAGTMGIRGTIVEWAYDDGVLVVILREGGTEICLASGSCQVLDQAGTYIVTDGEEFSGVRKYKGEGGELILEEADLDLLLAFLGGQRSFVTSPSGPLQGPPGQQPPAQPPGQPPSQPPAQPPGQPPSQPPSFDPGFPPIQTGAGNVPPGLQRQFDSGSPPPGLVKNRDPETFEPPGLQNRQ